MKQVPKGCVVTINDLRAALANKHKTDFTCPITTGIFSWIAAHAAAEDEAAGKKRITPYWRTLKMDGEVNPKYPGALSRSPNGCVPKDTRLFRRESGRWWRIMRRSCSPNYVEWMERGVHAASASQCK